MAFYENTSHATLRRGLPWIILLYYYTPRQRKLIGQHNPQSEQGRVRSYNVAYTTALIPIENGYKRFRPEV